MSIKPDFSGWATRYNVHCLDGRTILPDAFSDCEGKEVPLVWGHDHSSPYSVLGHAVLHHAAGQGVRTDCFFNDTEAGKVAKELVKNRDITSLSIWANELVEKASNVCHGAICEVSLVLKGANKGAYIDTVLAHGADGVGEGCMWMGDDGEFSFPEDSVEEEHIEHSAEKKEEEKEMAEEKKEPEKKEETGEKTVGDVMDDIEKKLTPEEMNVVYGLIGMAAEEGANDDDEEEKEMKHNAFDVETQSANYLSHSDEEEIVALSKKLGSWKDAVEAYAEEHEGVLAHDGTSGAAPVGGFIQDTTQSGNVTWLFPDYKDLKSGAPELITDDQTWQEKIVSKAHKLPFSRIRTGQVDIRKIDALRAKGYEKGNFKTYSGNFKLVRRTTDPQTIYVKNALHKDDITDITDFDYVNYVYQIDQMMLKNEIATAILFGDGREVDDPDKIDPEHIRPIWTDDDLYTIKAVIDISAAKAAIQGTDTAKNFSDNYVLAEAFIEKMLYTREKFKGTGTPDLIISPHMLNVMMLSRDLNGRRIYGSLEELRSNLNVNSIITCEQIADKRRTVEDGSSTKTLQLDALVVNLADYALGSTKGGEISHFTQFDIHYNQELSLIETRLSGALTRPYAAIAIEEEVAAG